MGVGLDQPGQRPTAADRPVAPAAADRLVAPAAEPARLAGRRAWRAGAAVRRVSHLYPLVSAGRYVLEAFPVVLAGLALQSVLCVHFRYGGWVA
jgi:hypothetical protein